MAGRKRPSKSNRRGMAAIAGIVVVLLICLLVQSRRLGVQNGVYESKKADLEQEIRDEELRSEEIEDLKDYVNSTEYIEQAAREKLGLVYSDETIFMPEE